MIRPAFRRKGSRWLGYCCANDLYEAFALRRAVDRAGLEPEDHVFLYATTTATLFEPADRLSRGVLRFDALASENRRSPCCLPVRLLERRPLRRLAGFLPMSLLQWPGRASLDSRVLGHCPPPLPPTLTAAPTRPGPADVLCYARPPDKKGLAVVLSAWARSAARRDEDLVVTGLGREEAMKTLRGAELPDHVRFAGLLSPEAMGRTLSESRIFLSASKFEDFGSSQLEALASGLVLVTIASPGGYDAGALARRLDPRLVVPAGDNGTRLAAALDVALRMDGPALASYRERAVSLTQRYSEKTLRHTVRGQVVPALREVAASCPPRRRAADQPRASALRRQPVPIRKAWAMMMAVRLHLTALVGRRPVTDDGDAVVCLTSYGRRARLVHIAIESIARGKVRPRRLILWLDEESNPRRPSRALRRLQRRGLEIRRCANLGPHKKWFPYVSTKPSDGLPLVTADDDAMYPPYWLEGLIDAARRHPRDIIGYRIREMTFTGPGRPAPYSSWPLSSGGLPRRANFVTGVSGVLYPASFLEHLAAEGRGFTETSPRADDIWLTSVAIRHGVAIRQVGQEAAEFPHIPGTWSSALAKSNVGDGSNDRQLLATFTEEELSMLSAPWTARSMEVVAQPGGRPLPGPPSV
jgi:glycosyltransferase involved in cell wall biosynthesis